jgi:hypothetical protein
VLAHGQIEHALDELARGQSWSKTARIIRDEYLYEDAARQLRACWQSLTVYYDKADSHGPRKWAVKRCKHVCCPSCGPYDHKMNTQAYATRFKTLHPDGLPGGWDARKKEGSLDVIHMVFTIPEWMRETILRRPTPTPIIEQAMREAAAQRSPKTRPKHGLTTTPGLEAIKQSARQTIADMYFDGDLARCTRSAAILCNLHVLGDKAPWPVAKPHLDIVLAGHYLDSSKLERLPTRISKRMFRELSRTWAGNLRESRALRAAMASHLDELTSLEDLEYAFVNVARGSRGQGVHRTAGHAYHTIKYSTRPMFTLAHAKLVGPDGTSNYGQSLETLVYEPKLKKPRFFTDGTRRGAKPVARMVAPVASAMRTINGLLGLMKGAHVHAMFGTMKPNYAKAMRALGREAIPLHGPPSGIEWGKDRRIAKIQGHWYDPGPRTSHPDESDLGASEV